MMRNVINWMKEIALSEKGSAMIEGQELDVRVAALDELSSNMHNMNGAQFREVMTTAHFADYFSDALSRSFYDDYEYQRGQWPEYTYADEAPDFRNVNRFRMSEPETLLKRREKGEAKAGSITASLVEYGVDEFARQFDVSWRTILNDDLGKIRETPRRMAEAAARFEDSFVSALYDNATTQAALVALGANYSGTGKLTKDNLTLGLQAMTQRTDAIGNLISHRRIGLVIPSMSAITAADILQNILAFGNGEDSNVLAQFIAGVYVDPYIAISGTDVPWYLVSLGMPTISVARLRGAPGPFTFMKASNIDMITGNAPSEFLMGSFGTGDIEFAVETIIGGWDDSTYVGVTDYQGIYYSDGSTA